MLSTTVREGEKHPTASVFLVTPDRSEMLLILHKKLGVWLQPGGHQEWFEGPWEAAVRECEEETGIDISTVKETEVVDDVVRMFPIPDFIQEQKIPPHKDQPEHYHLDCMYVVEILKQDIRPEYPDAQWAWMSLEDIMNSDQVFENLKVTAQRILR